MSRASLTTGGCITAGASDMSDGGNFSFPARLQVCLGFAIKILDWSALLAKRFGGQRKSVFSRQPYRYSATMVLSFLIQI